jgi:endoglucanase
MRRRSIVVFWLVVGVTLSAWGCGSSDKAQPSSSQGGASNLSGGASSQGGSGRSSGNGSETTFVGGSSGSSETAATGGSSAKSSGGAATGGSSAKSSSATATAGGSSATPPGSSGGTTAATGRGGAAGTAAMSGVPLIVVDQFGYRPDSEKIAVIRDPQTGFDASVDFTPGDTYAVVDATSGAQVFTGPVTPWNNGAVHAASGDKAYWFEFTSVNTPGTYYVLDVQKNQRSPEFRIANDVYKIVLRHALRTFFYQRVGQEKKAPYAEASWTDSASHVGALQDHNARRYDAKNDASTERDIWGGWYDAGDYNKYTSWTANYVVEMLQAYEENPDAFGDDFGIPESGNGVSDILDEARWGLEYLTRLQESDGSMLSVVGEDSGSPPSSATGQTLYGKVNTSGTLASAAAFASGARVFAKLSDAAFTTLATDLASRADKAFTWAEANPAVTFKNNDSASGTSGLAAGQQEVDAAGLVAYRIKAAVGLFRLTGSSTYSAIVDDLYPQMGLIKWSFAYPFEVDHQDMLLYYADAAGATTAVRDDIRSKYKTSVTTGDDNLLAHTTSKDPYLSHMKDYTWGSNSTKSNQGNLFWAMVTHGLDTAQDDTMKRIAERYIHYIHGLNPLGLVYLSNMSTAGAQRSVSSFYHTWFNENSAQWSRVTAATPGPAPGFLTGGPNSSYSLDGCCPSGCGSSDNNAKCDSAAVTPPLGQPDMKSYLDFNGNWPLDSWSVTENSCGYQIAYIRLLSKFVH